MMARNKGEFGCFKNNLPTELNEMKKNQEKSEKKYSIERRALLLQLSLWGDWFASPTQCWSYSFLFVLNVKWPQSLNNDSFQEAVIGDFTTQCVQKVFTPHISKRQL